MKKIVVLLIVVISWGCRKDESISYTKESDCELRNYCYVSVNTQDKVLCITYSGVDGDWYKLISPNRVVELKVRVDSLVNVEIYRLVSDHDPVSSFNFTYTESCINHTIIQTGDSIINN